MSTRVNLTIVNNSGLTLTCTDIQCETFTNLKVGQTIAAGGENTFTSDSNDRLFATFTENAPGLGSWQVALTCPRSADNSACGSYNAGLQTYAESGTPAEFKFIVGTPNLADWDSGTADSGNVVPYGQCSRT